MIEGAHPILQALYGTLFTWFVTALGASLVFLLDIPYVSFNEKLLQQILDTMLGFAGGVMLAASYWSLLAPSIDLAKDHPEIYGEDYVWVPAAVGFLAGGAVMLLTGRLLDYFDESTSKPASQSTSDQNTLVEKEKGAKKKKKKTF